MSLRRTVSVVAITAAFALAGCATSNQNKSAAAPAEAMTAPTPEEMAAMMELGQPGDQHERMANMVGNWDVTGYYIMAPGEPRVDTAASCRFTSVLDGRFIRQDYNGSMMGMPFIGVSFDGYDRVEEEYVSYWFSNMGTGCFVSTGQYDDATKTLTMVGSQKDPMSGSMMTMTMTMTEISSDKYAFQMLTPLPDGSQMEMMNLTYTRALDAK